MIRMMVGTNSPHLEELQFLLAKMGQRAGTLPRTAAAIKDGAALIRDKWQKYATGETSMPGLKPSGSYAKSIRSEQKGEFAHEIFSESKIAERVENGTEELDMKRTHPYGPRSRMSESTGYPYVIIPFRWGTPEDGDGKRVGFGKNVIPAGVYYKQLVKKEFGASKVKASPNTSGYETPNAHGQMVGRARHKWGSRLRGDDFDGTAEEKNRMNGMVRFENGYNKEGNISKRYGGYFTFRVISANPESESFKKNKWIKPATPALHVAEIVAREMRKDVETMVDAAIKRDLNV
jgi:hypothetical protein